MVINNFLELWPGADIPNSGLEFLASIAISHGFPSCSRFLLIHSQQISSSLVLRSIIDLELSLALCLSFSPTPFPLVGFSPLLTFLLFPSSSSGTSPMGTLTSVFPCLHFKSFHHQSQSCLMVDRRREEGRGRNSDNKVSPPYFFLQPPPCSLQICPLC